MDHGFIPNLHVILLGDSQRAGAYLPYGKHLVRQILASRQPYGKRVARPGAGILVEAWVNGEHRWVRITAEPPCELFLESGYVEPGDIGLSSPTRYDPSVIDTAFLDYTSDPLYGALKFEDGGVPTIPKQAVADGSVLKAFDAGIDETTGVLPQDGELYFKKVSAAKCYSSVFTGKTRLLVQAWYGKKFLPDGYKIVPESYPYGFVQPALVVKSPDETKELRIASTAARTSVVFTSQDGTYWLIDITTKLTVYPIILTSCGASLAQYIRKQRSAMQPEIVTKLEAYVFSGARIGFDQSFIIGDTDTYAPLAYGWKSKWDGSECAIVDVVGVSLGGPNQFAYKSRLVKLEFTRNVNIDVSAVVEDPIAAEKAKWSVKQTVGEYSGYWNMPWAEASILYPDYTQSVLLHKGPPNVNLVPIDGTGPVYCYYTRADEFKLIEYSRSSTSTSVAEEADPCPAALYGYAAKGKAVSYKSGITRTTAEYVFSGLGAEGVSLHYDAFASRSTHSIGDTPISSSSVGASAYDPVNPQTCFADITSEQQEAVDAYAAVNAEWISGGASGCIGTYYAVSAVDYEYTAEWTSDTGVVDAVLGHLSLVVPYDDCEAAYIFRLRHVLKTAATHAAGTYGIFAARRLHVARYISGTCGTSVVTEGVTLPEYPYYKLVTHSGTTVNDGATTFESTVETAGWAYNSFGEIPGGPTLDTLTAILSPSTSAPYSTKICATRTSAGLGSVWGSDLETVDYGDNTSPIGWA